MLYSTAKKANGMIKGTLQDINLNKAVNINTSDHTLRKGGTPMFTANSTKTKNETNGVAISPRF